MTSNGHDPLLVCDGCGGLGTFDDRWGSFRCGLCDGAGVLARSAWLAYAASFLAMRCMAWAWGVWS